MTQLIFGKDQQGYNAYAPPVSNQMYSATLASGGNASITLPITVSNPNRPGYFIVAFSFAAGADIWVAYNGNNAAAPAGATFASTNSELNPGTRIIASTYVNGSNVTVANRINILNNGAGSADIWVALYAVS